MTATKYYLGEPGTYSIIDPELSGRVILRVAREGLGYNYTTGSIGSREYSYTIGLGSVTFLNFFGGDISHDAGRETVMVRYKL